MSNSRLPWFITWSEAFSSYKPTLGFATGDEAYRMACAIADRLGVGVEVYPPADGDSVQPALKASPKEQAK